MISVTSTNQPQYTSSREDQIQQRRNAAISLNVVQYIQKNKTTKRKENSPGKASFSRENNKQKQVKDVFYKVEY